MTAPGVSIVLPTRNGEATLPAVLESLRRQRFDRPFEIVAVDSGSTDGTRALLERQADRLIVIRPDAFDHGLTRNLGIQQARGALVVLTVQDAVPASDTWLAALVAPLLADVTIAGTFARQIPAPDASALARRSLAGWVAAGPVGRTVALRTGAQLEAMTPLERLRHCAFDNVCSCIRRSVWAAHPFRSTCIAEDLEWGRDVLLAGHRLAYVPEAAVVHSHDRPLAYEFTRTRQLHGRLFDLFGLQTIPTLPRLAQAIAVTAADHLRWERSPARIPRALGLALVWPAAQYLGARDALSGRRARRDGPR